MTTDPTLKTPLIYTQRRRLPRTVDVLLTVLAWAVFVYLFFTGFLGVISQRAQPGAHLHFGLLFATIDTLAFYLLIGALNAAILALWAKYNQIRRRGGERRSSIPALEDSQLMESFALPEPLLAVLRDHQIVTVHNDDHGRIAHVEAGNATKVHRTQPVVAGAAAAAAVPVPVPAGETRRAPATSAGRAVPRASNP